MPHPHPNHYDQYLPTFLVIMNTVTKEPEVSLPE
jgi:hypothetical protein